MATEPEVDFFPSTYQETADTSYTYSQQRSGLNTSMDPYANASFEDEPPLLDELGIYPSHIWARTKAVLNPFSKAMDDTFLEDRDVAGPLVFSLLLGVCLLMTGKMYMGYILGLGLTGSWGMFLLLHLMTEHNLDFYQVISVLGYCILPIVVLAAVAIVVDMHRTFGGVLGLLVVMWCTKSATSIFEVALEMREQRYLIAYPVALFYLTFILFAIFK